MPTIFARLKADHDLHRSLLSELEDCPPQKCAALFAQFRIEVAAHAAAEEQSLYADMMADPKLQDKARHSVAEHATIDDLLDAVDREEAGSEPWRDALAKLARCYRHHIEEEEDEVFAIARRVISPLRSEDLAERFDDRKPDECIKAGAEIEA